MARTPSTMLELGTPAPDFSLPDTRGNHVSLSDFAQQPALLVVFMCNHCPYVIRIQEGLAQLGKDYLGKGLAMVGINANDAANYPDDSPAKMAEAVNTIGYTFPYLYDEQQSVAKAYQAACTPDFFLFNQQRELVYRGQFDDARPRNDAPVTGKDIRCAIDAVLAGKSVSTEQKASLGCNIKWKPGNEPDYYHS